MALFRSYDLDQPPSGLGTFSATPTHFCGTLCYQKSNWCEPTAKFELEPYIISITPTYYFIFLRSDLMGKLKQQHHLTFQYLFRHIQYLGIFILHHSFGKTSNIPVRWSLLHRIDSSLSAVYSYSGSDIEQVWGRRS